MTRIESNPVFLSLETETTAPSAARKTHELDGKDGFAEIFAGIAVHPPAMDTAVSSGPGVSSGLEGDGSGIALQRVALSPSMRLIMPAATPLPDSASLHAFARLQGLDEGAIQQLFGPAAGPDGSAVDGFSALAVQGPSGEAALDTAAAVLAAPMMMGWAGDVLPSGSLKPLAETEWALPPAGNLLSIGGGRSLLPASVPSAEVSQAVLSQLAMGDEVEVIALDVSASEVSLTQLQDPTTLAQSASGDGPAMDVMQTVLGTWDEVSVNASVTGATRSLRGQTLMAGDLMPAMVHAADDVSAPPGVTSLADASGSGASSGQAGSGWTATGAGQNTTMAGAQSMETGDVATSRQLSDQLVQRMGEQIAQRLMNKLAQGEWHFKFVLNPKHMGEIQVNLRMHAGNLDGTFVANQSATREMLGEGLQRLKDVLSSAGMNVANFDVGADHSSRQGRQAMTPSQTTPALAPQGLQQVSPEVNAARTRGSSGGEQGWDVLV